MEGAGKRRLSFFGAGSHVGGMLFWKTTMEEEILVLLGRRSHGIDRGRWSIPGGSWRKEDGFSPGGGRNYHTAALRKGYEETGYIIPEQDEVTCIWSVHAPFFHYEVFDYRIREKHAAIHLTSEDFSEWGWFDIKALPEPLEWFLPLQLHQFKKKLHRRERLKNAAFLM